MNDCAYNALANEHRRELLLALLEENSVEATDYGPVDGDAGAVMAKHQLGTEMYHTHLPKLAGYGFIHWTPGSTEIGKGPAFDEIRPLLEVLADSAKS